MHLIFYLNQFRNSFDLTVTILQDQQLTKFKRATFDSSCADGFSDVFVSAATGPHQFWVQVSTTVLFEYRPY